MSEILGILPVMWEDRQKTIASAVSDPSTRSSAKRILQKTGFDFREMKVTFRIFLDLGSIRMFCSENTKS